MLLTGCFGIEKADYLFAENLNVVVQNELLELMYAEILGFFRFNWYQKGETSMLPLIIWATRYQMIIRLIPNPDFSINI